MCEYPAIDNRTFVKAARKRHMCSECYKPIEIGQPYEQYDALFDGSWGHSKFCQSCQAAWKAIWSMDEHHCETPIGEAWNLLCDYGIAIPYWHYDHYRERMTA